MEATGQLYTVVPAASGCRTTGELSRVPVAEPEEVPGFVFTCDAGSDVTCPFPVTLMTLFAESVVLPQAVRQRAETAISVKSLIRFIRLPVSSVVSGLTADSFLTCHRCRY